VTTAMGAELAAATEEGRALVAVAEACAASFVEGAVARDRDGRFADDHLAQLRAVGYLKGPIPVELGGGGVSSTRDVLVAASRLARGDPSTAIGVNMHFAVVLNIVRHWRIATTRTEVERADALATMLRRIAEGDVVLAAAASEPAPQNLTRPSTTAQRAGDGWVVHGQKSFATMAPAATMLNVAVTYQDDDGVEHYGFAMIPTAAAGVELHDDWDALGMRASASGSVSFHGVRLERGQVHDGFPVGTFSVEFHDRYLTSGALNASASLGIAEAAHDHVLGRLRGRPDAVLDDPHATMRLADNMVDLATMRAVFDRAGRLIDDFHAAFPTGAFALQDIQTVFGEVQAAKVHVHDAACRVVDRALALRGGGGYLTASPLAKAWRDVRAGAFMHPLGDNRAYAYLATTALGVPPPSR
jgi:alkylation response protein AidB-like acyl-CoA dehydrogenase